jgi:hypothetical protein
MTLSDDAGHAIAALTENDRISDSTGAEVGHVDWKTPEVIVGTYREALAFDVEIHGISVVTTMATFHVLVDESSELVVDGRRVGKLTGFSPSKEGWRRLAALVLAIPMLPTPPRAAPTPASEVASPPPPPPPPPAPPSQRN